MSWGGVFPYLATPLTGDGRVDADALRKLVRRVIDAGVHGVTPLGSTGEFPYLADRDRQEVIAATVEAAAGRVPVVAGVGGFSAEETVRQAQAAARLGADGLLCILQAYFPLSDREILAYFEAVAAATELPVVIYHHPGVCHLRLTPSLVETLAQIPSVSYMKEASGTMDFFTASPRLRDAGMRLFAATAFSPTAAMLFGAVGWMSGPACVFPAESVCMYELCRSGRWDVAAEVERALNGVLAAFRRLGPAASIKALLRADGIDVGPPVAPISPVDEDLAPALRHARESLARVIDDLAPELVS